MIGQLFHLIGGWREVRASMGFSYQVARNGRRRIIPIDGYRKRGLADETWVATGTFADDGLSERFRDFSFVPSKEPKRVRKAKLDFALNQ
ncbi:MAG: hypothetical protein QOF78_1888 [Phycisphaerales bacterium]|jgi:hypothetical protein|nr:hypothetical protein [Phycisphaerales bacterium]MEA2734208.1 hypothetical protein [Humisphaera sp.]